MEKLKGLAFILDAVEESSKDGKHIYEYEGIRVVSQLCMECVKGFEDVVR